MSELDNLAARLRLGNIVAYPTEAVMGLGCDPMNEAAVKRICALKNRNVDQGFLLIAAEFSQLEKFLDLSKVPETALERVFRTWPGPHTWIFPHSLRAPSWVRGNREGIAVRVTDHETAAMLCLAFGGALVSTSANPHGSSPARDASSVEDYFRGKLDAILDAPVGKEAQPTIITDVLTGRVLRLREYR